MKAEGYSNALTLARTAWLGCQSLRFGRSGGAGVSGLPFGAVAGLGVASEQAEEGLRRTLLFDAQPPHLDQPVLSNGDHGACRTTPNVLKPTTSRPGPTSPAEPTLAQHSPVPTTASGAADGRLSVQIRIDERKGKARQGKARQGKARQGKARQGKARQGKARQGTHLPQ